MAYATSNESHLLKYWQSHHSIIDSLQHVVRVHNWPFADYGHMVQKTPNWMAKDAEGQEKQTGYMI